MRVAVISDTHDQHKKIKFEEPYDVLIHCGDATMMGTVGQMQNFFDWFSEQPGDKFFVPGNHDWLFQNTPNLALDMASQAGVEVLMDREYFIDGVCFYGSPWSPKFGDWAFMKERSELNEVWSRIPDFTKILITHTPPMGFFDDVQNYMKGKIESVGCNHLRNQVLNRIKPDIHVFGHIHEHGGLTVRLEEGMVLSNTAMCNAAYDLVRKPFYFKVNQ